MLALRAAPEDLDAARAVVARSPSAFAAAIFREAADSDDVTSLESARDYLEGRLAFFSEMVGPDTATGVRHAFDELLRTWQ